VFLSKILYYIELTLFLESSLGQRQVNGLEFLVSLVYTENSTTTIKLHLYDFNQLNISEVEAMVSDK